MEKSIESIWKQGFLKNDALIAPKLNKLYNQKSIHLIDKFKRMFRINLYAIVAGSFLFLVISFLIGIPLMGTGFFLTLSAIAIVNKRLSRGLNNIDKSQNSYHYIKAFDNWMRQQMRVNRTMARCYYPLFFLSFVLGFWHYHINERQLGELIVNKLIDNNPGMNHIFGVPLIIILGVVLLMALFSYLGGRIYNWDIKLVYGNTLRKLDEMIADMEELRS